MKNKGFSIVECVVCMLLLSTVTIGIVSSTITIEYRNKERVYKNAVYSNFHTIFRVCDLSNDPKEQLISIYKDLVEVVDDNNLIINIELSDYTNTKNKNNLKYHVTFEETLDNRIVYVKVLDVDRNYEELNDESLSKRVYPK